jgi:hypothetical protein
MNRPELPDRQLLPIVEGWFELSRESYFASRLSGMKGLIGQMDRNQWMDSAAK